MGRARLKWWERECNGNPRAWGRVPLLRAHGKGTALTTNPFRVPLVQKCEWVEVNLEPKCSSEWKQPQVREKSTFWSETERGKETKGFQDLENDRSKETHRWRNKRLIQLPTMPSHLPPAVPCSPVVTLWDLHLLCPFYRQRNWGCLRLSGWMKIIQLVPSQIKI